MNKMHIWVSKRSREPLKRNTSSNCRCFTWKCSKQIAHCCFSLPAYGNSDLRCAPWTRGVGQYQRYSNETRRVWGTRKGVDIAFQSHCMLGFQIAIETPWKIVQVLLGLPTTMFSARKDPQKYKASCQPHCGLPLMSWFFTPYLINYTCTLQILEASTFIQQIKIGVW